ncbi:MAG TPA: N-acetylglucosamine-6-phosphate deacetylase [Bacillota bacterium]|nr:N-acetylglucosamine-6-phosphate deacetylase [Bacillota bacterium]
MGKPIVLTNATILTPLRQIERGALLVEAGLIKEFGPVSTVTVPNEAQVINLLGAYLSPGFIDLHLHGAWGGDVMAGTVEDLTKMAQGLVKGGVTSFLPTTLSGSLSDITKALDAISQAMWQDLGGAEIIGAHLEGPYFNASQKGAQNPEYIITPNPRDYLPILDEYTCIKRVSAAPELPGALQLGRELQKRGIVASIAHSSATYQEVLLAIENGYTHATHIFSGMSGLQRVKAYRVSGVIESVLLMDELTTEMIADGHHLPPSLMKLVLKTKGLEKVCLVTDSMAAAGHGPGKYNLGGLEVLIEEEIPSEFEIATQPGNYVAKLADRSAFASSVANMNQLVSNMVNLVGLNVLDAVRLVTLNPARMQERNPERGLIAPGLRADLTVFDKEFNILLTMVNGKVVYQKGKGPGPAKRQIRQE